MTYKSVLPTVFPFLWRGSPNHIRQLVAALLDANRSDISQGSSFAVTVDNWDGTWNLWLSRASYEYLQDFYKFPN